MSRGHEQRTDAEELAIVERIRSGDPDAWAELLGPYQDRLFAVCVRMIGDREMAADLAQDAMVRIIQRLDTFKGGSKLSTWMIRVPCLHHAKGTFSHWSVRATRTRKLQINCSCRWKPSTNTCITPIENWE